MIDNCQKCGTGYGSRLVLCKVTSAYLCISCEQAFHELPWISSDATELNLVVLQIHRAENAPDLRMNELRQLTDRANLLAAVLRHKILAWVRDQGAAEVKP